uniref:Gp5 n=1 Tax=Sclerotinia sclerotiorum negative-stranded RNA virus 4A TaxID=3071285 RepID=A0A2Z4QKN5_9MONO|nr:gp5 [Sclerotinia sclerotiorum negative-stranded RNA virus 4-A]
MSPSYKEKLSLAETKLRMLIEGGVLESLEKAKIAFVHATVQAKTQSLLNRIRDAAEIHSLQVPSETPQLPFEAEWMTVSSQAIKAIETAELLVAQLSDKLASEKAKSRPLRSGGSLDTILKQIQMIEDSANSPPSIDCLDDSHLSAMGDTFKTLNQETQK